MIANVKFDIDEPLFSVEHALCGILSIQQITDLEDEWKAVKIDEWGAYNSLVSATDAVYRASGLPCKAPLPMAWIRAIDRADDGDTVAAQAITRYQDTARAYERVRTAKVGIRARAHIAW